MATMRLAVRAIVNAAPGVFREGVALTGAFLVSYGAGLIYFPAGLMVGGAAMVAYSFLLARAAE